MSDSKQRGRNRHFSVLKRIEFKQLTLMSLQLLEKTHNQKKNNIQIGHEIMKSFIKD